MPAEDTSSSDSDQDEPADKPDQDERGGQEDDDEEEQLAARPLEGGYDPTEFEDLECSEDVRELFSYITRYQAHTIELEHSLKPFIPDYIPAVGDIDAFLKIPRPDGNMDNTGLT